jgi:Bifunctional DNA primase/polymerase, N-terminal/Primase C terminal 1 (PriCT-1)
MELYAENHSNAPNRSTILAQALDAAATGRAVFPLSMKYPAIAKRNGGRGHLDASHQPQRITAMFNSVSWKASGYGVATGERSGIIVADVDGSAAVEKARDLGLRSDHVVRSGKPDSWHLYYKQPEGVEIPTFTLAEGIHIRGEGAYVAGAGSLHPSGNTYRVARDGDPAPLPECILKAAEEIKAGERTKTGAPKGVVSVDANGPDIPEHTRNDTLTAICGTLHDGTRDLDALIADLWAINVARCKPEPLSHGEVEKIATSIIKRRPCRPRSRRRASAPVLRALDYLRAKAETRTVKGMAGGTGWSCYFAGLDAAEEYGREHELGVTLRLDLRTWAHRAGSSRSAVSRFVERSPLVRVIKPASGRRPAVILFAVPRDVLTGHKVGHKNHLGDRQENNTSASVPLSALRGTLRRLRWGTGRIGKTRAAILDKLAVTDGGELSRAHLAEALGRKPASLREPLRWLVDAGLIIRPHSGYYALPQDIQQRIADAREMTEEPRSDRLQLAGNHRERRAYHEELDRREREKRKRQERSRDGAPGRSEEPEEETVSDKSRESVDLSHRKREEHFEQAPPPAKPDEPQPREADEEAGELCPIRQMFASPPEWLARQVRLCRGVDAPRLRRCTSYSVARVVFGDGSRWREVLPILDDVI